MTTSRAWLFLVMCGIFDAGTGVGYWDFADDRPNERPAGFYFDTTGRAEKARWRVIADGDNHVLAQLDRGRDKNRMALAVVQDTSVGDLRLSARIKVVAGETEEVGGLVWRYRNSENYLCARLDTDENNVLLYRVVNGNRIKFGGEDDLRLKKGEWHTLRVEHRGEVIKVYLGDEMLFDETDRHFKDAGKIGLWTKGDSVTYFDDLRVARLDRRGGDDDDD